MLVETVSKQTLAPWFTVIKTVVPHAAVTVIVPVRKAPGFAVTETVILPLFNPDSGVTAIHIKDSETVQVEFEDIFTV